MVKNFRLGKLNCTFVFRHRWDVLSKRLSDRTFRSTELGLSFRRVSIVGAKGFKTPSKWGKNMVKSYTFTLKLLILQILVNWDWGGMHIKTK